MWFHQVTSLDDVAVSVSVWSPFEGSELYEHAVKMFPLPIKSSWNHKQQTTALRLALESLIHSFEMDSMEAAEFVQWTLTSSRCVCFEPTISVILRTLCESLTHAQAESQRVCIAFTLPLTCTESARRNHSLIQELAVYSHCFHLAPFFVVDNLALVHKLAVRMNRSHLSNTWKHSRVLLRTD